MNRYRKTLQIRIALLVVAVLMAVILGVYDVFFAPASVKENPIFGFQCGSLTTIGLLAFIPTIRYQKALREEKALQLLYNQEHDERMKAIRAKAGMPLIGITSGLMFIAAVVCGYFNATAFYALLIAAAVQMTISCIIKLVARAKM